MVSSVDRTIQEIASRSQQVNELAKEYAFSTPDILLDPVEELDLEKVPGEIDRDEFIIERKRLQDYVSVSEEFKNIHVGGAIELLNLIHKYKLIDSVPNIEIALRVFLTMGTSIAAFEKSYSNLKLIKNLKVNDE